MKRSEFNEKIEKIIDDITKEIIESYNDTKAMEPMLFITSIEDIEKESCKVGMVKDWAIIYDTMKNDESFFDKFKEFLKKEKIIFSMNVSEAIISIIKKDENENIDFENMDFEKMKEEAFEKLDVLLFAVETPFSSKTIVYKIKEKELELLNREPFNEWISKKNVGGKMTNLVTYIPNFKTKGDLNLN
jgi:hypothetical protein